MAGTDPVCRAQCGTPPQCAEDESAVAEPLTAPERPCTNSCKEHQRHPAARSMPPPTPPSLVALTIWTALLLYAAGEYGRTRRPAAAWARPVWLLGAAAYLAHVAAAFATHHGWSHAAAYAYTAARTEALLGLAWGGGLWVNYAFTVLWVGEALWWQMRPAGYAGRAPAWTPAVRGAFLFMIVNGAVVFVDGPGRWLGVAIVAALAGIWRAEGRAGGISGRRRVQKSVPLESAP